MMNNSENIKEMLEKLALGRDEMGDVTFIVGGQQIRAHRNVLAAISPKYKAQFYGPNPDQGEIRIENVSAAAFKKFMEFFYKESIDLTMDNIENVLDLAKQSLVDGFVEICVDFLKKLITSTNVCFVYRLAIFYDIESLRLDCEQHISSKTMDVFGSDDFLQCNRDVLLNILNLDMLDCTESEVFNACIAWARADCDQNGLDGTKPKNLRAALGNAIYEVRFASMNAEEFAILHKSMDGFFTADEQTELLYITTKMKDFTPKMFNDSPRTPYNPPRDRLEYFNGPSEWSRECNRFERLIKLYECDTTKVNCDDFVFVCTEPIRLHGFVLGFQFDNSILDKFLETNVMKVRFDDGYDPPFIVLRPKFVVYQSSLRNNETIILFENPIQFITAFYCDFQRLFLPLNYRLDLKRTVMVNNNEFTFSHDGGLVTRILFDSRKRAGRRHRQF